jgi:hypothetical protein
MSIVAYQELIARKAVTFRNRGFDPYESLFPSAIKPFQRDIVSLSCRRGRSAVFAATGLGKTIEELSWLRQVVAHTGGRAILFAPLGVARQIVEVEAPKFGFDEVTYAADEISIKTAITVTNYERRHKFDLPEFNGVALDESGIIKDKDSSTFKELSEACAQIPYILCASATPAPNDWTELGQHSELLGVMTSKEMLATFFVHDGSVRAGGGSDWRLKRHAEQDFWRWLASWSVMIRHPRDLGYDDRDYDLPELDIIPVTVAAEYKHDDGLLFPMVAETLQDRRIAQRESLEDRVAEAAMIVAREPNEPWLVWCHLNKEAEMLQRVIPWAVNVQGSDTPDSKAENLLGFCNGKPLHLITKPSIGGRGMNWQHCNRMIFVGLNDSFEELFQSIRRCWRFGQTRPVKVYMIASEREGSVAANLREKERKYEQMADAMAAHMKDLTIASIHRGREIKIEYGNEEMRVPSWLAA